MTLSAKVEFAGYVFETGKDLMDVQISLGTNTSSTTCMVQIADPSNRAAAAFINHSLSEGGIQQLIDPEAKTQAVGDDFEQGVPVSGAVTRGAEFDAVTLAAMDVVAWKETSSPNTIAAYYSNNGVPGSMGSFTDQDIIDGGGFPKTAGTKFNVGRYQFRRGDWQDAKRADPRIKGFSPKDQDLVALYKFKSVNRGWKELRAGAIDQFLLKANNEWKSVPGRDSSQVQAGVTTQQYLDYYKQRLAFHQGSVGGTKTVAPKNKAVPSKPNTTDTLQPVVKGSIIKVSIGAYVYEFIHQSTETNDGGVTTIMGQGLRWIMSRRKKSATYKGTTLKQLATTICSEYKLKLEYQAKSNPEYTYLDQSGISDYKLLTREVEANGLMMTESKTAIVIKDREALGDSTLVLSRAKIGSKNGNGNLLSYTISDKALSGDEPPISKTLPQLPKTYIDPLTGKMVSVAKDVTTGSKPTGKAKDKPSGTLKAGKATQLIERAKTKRIYGLPSEFVLPLTQEHLSIVPLSTATTSDLPGCLGNRIWVITGVKHNLASGTTSLSMSSPVEVLDVPKPKVKETDSSGSSNLVDSGSLRDGSINDRIFKAAKALKNFNTSTGPGNGRVACAWVVNRHVLRAAGIRGIGTNLDYVDSVRAAMDAGRGKLVSKAEAMPGDVVIWGTAALAHIGIYMGDGQCLSNSSSRASFSWLAPYSTYESFYNGVSKVYRVQN